MVSTKLRGIVRILHNSYIKPAMLECVGKSVLVVVAEILDNP